MTKFIIDERAARNDITRESLMSVMANQAVSVTFTKRDGKQRTMKVTLDPTLMPAVNSTQIKDSVDSSNSAVIRCFETALQEWRSFRMDSLIEVVL